VNINKNDMSLNANPPCLLPAGITGGNGPSTI